MRTKLIALILFLIPTIGWAEETKSEPMKQALADIIQGATKTAGEAKDFLSAQLPDVIRQLLMWKMAESAVATLLSVALLVTFSLLMRRALTDEVFTDASTNGYSYKPKKGVPRLILGVISCIGTVIGIICTIVNLCNPTWLQIWIAPKVYLLEYARSLIK